MKRVGKIFGGVILGVLLTVYVAVALLNYSVVQSYLGTAVGEYFSKEWGGTVKIGALHATPFDHLILNNLLLVSPDGDTILRGDAIKVRFNGFPYHDNTLDLNRVYLRNVYYHFSNCYEGADINLTYIINYFKSERPQDDQVSPPFTVKAKTLILNNVHYKMDLNTQPPEWPHGVRIPHMEFFNINAKMKNIKVISDDVTCRIVRLSTTERSGFRVDKISGDVHVSGYDITTQDLYVETPKSRIMLNTRMEYDGWEAMDDYEKNVMHEAEIKEGTTVAMSDVAFWAPVLWGIKAQIKAEGKAGGTINNLSTEGLRLSWSDESRLFVKGLVRGLPNIDTTWFDVDVEQLYTPVADLEVIARTLPGVTTLPDNQGLEYIDLQANLRGCLFGQCNAGVDMSSNLGNLKVDGSKHGRSLTAELNSDGLGLSMLGSDWLTHSGLDVSVKSEIPVKGRRWQDWRAKLEGRLTNTVVKGHRLAPTTVNASLTYGKLDLNIETTDTLAQIALDATADLSDEQHRYRCDLQVERLDSRLFALPSPTKKKDHWLLSLEALKLEARGDDLEHLQGDISVRRLHYGDFQLRRLDANLENGGGKRKWVSLNSDLADAELNGDFQWSDLALAVADLRERCVPVGVLRPKSESAGVEAPNCAMQFNIRWKDSQKQLEKLADGIRVAEGSRIDGSYNSWEGLKLVGRSSEVKIGATTLEGLGLTGRNTMEGYVVECESQRIGLGNLTLFDDITLTGTSDNQRLMCELQWGDEESASSGDLLFRLRDDRVDVLKPHFRMGEQQWTIDCPDGILVGGGVRSESVVLSCDRQRIEARAHIVGRSNDCLELQFNRFNLEPITALLLHNSPLHIEGAIDGHFTLYGLNETPYFNANLTIDSSLVNGQSLGTLACHSNWNAELNILNLQLNSESVHASGWLELGQKSPGLNFNASFDRFDLAMVAPLLSDFSSRFEGQLHGNFNVIGTVEKPTVIGEAYVDNGALKVDFTDVTYYFNDSLRFGNNQVVLDNFTIIDPLGNVARADGKLYYDRLEEIGMDITLNTDNFLVMNIKESESFYGTVLASAEGRVTGTTNELNIDVRARTNTGSTLTVPVSEKRQVKGQNYITFVNSSSGQSQETVKNSRQSNLHIEADLSVTPDTRLVLPMEFSQISATVSTAGEGEVHLSYNGTGNPDVKGGYELTDGTMKIGLLGLIEKNFTIERGSNLNFQGSLPDTRFDLRAVYQQRVNMSTLTGSLSTVDNSQKYLQVEDVIAVSGTLQDPTIGFDIRLPNADQSVEEEVFAYIDRTNERDMLNQTVSLLLMGRFYNNSATSQAMDSPTTSASVGIGALTSFVTGMVDVVDIDVDYKAATELTREQVDVNISKDWGRWYIESTLGYGGDSHELEERNNGGAVVDALVGYRITPLLHIFAYNRTNTNDYTRIDLPYKQGVGLKLTKDFDRWSELFHVNRKK